MEIHGSRNVICSVRWPQFINVIFFVRSSSSLFFFTRILCNWAQASGCGQKRETVNLFSISAQFCTLPINMFFIFISFQYHELGAIFICHFKLNIFFNEFRRLCIENTRYFCCVLFTFTHISFRMLMS